MLLTIPWQDTPSDLRGVNDKKSYNMTDILKMLIGWDDNNIYLRINTAQRLKGIILFSKDREVRVSTFV